MAISKEDLDIYLETLKKTMVNFDYDCVRNVIFLNMESLYNYVNKFECQTNDLYTVDDVMNVLEPYIPFALTSETLNSFFEANEAKTTTELSYLENRFNKNSRMDFLNALRCISSENDWNYIKDTCEYLRQHEERIYK